MDHHAAADTLAAIPLTEEFPEIRDSVARICAGFPGTYWQGLEDERDVQKTYPHTFVKALGDAGYLATLIPEAYGGAGLPIRAATIVLETIHASGCNAGACHAQMYIMGTLLRHGSEEQKKKYLPKIASGELRLQAFGVTEPTSGSDTTKLKTRAVKQSDGSYVVNGQKIWTSRALQSDLMLLLARTTAVEDVKKKTDGLSVFLVDMKKAVADGSMEIKPIKALVNHNTNEVFFTNMRIPADALIGEEGKGFRYILDGMNAERILISSESIGDGRWFTQKSKSYGTDRVIFGRPVGANQGIQFPIAKAHAELEAAEMMMRKAAALFDAGQPCGPEANMGKYLAAEAAWHSAEACMQTHGGFAFAKEYDVERKWRECRLYQIAPISSNLVLAYVAEHVLGMPRSY